MDLGAKILLLIPLFVLVFAAATSQISQLSLAPVYGGIPSSVYQKPAVAVTFLLGFLLRSLWQPRGKYGALELLTVVSFLVPAVELPLFWYTDNLGPEQGPAITSFLTCHVIIIPAAYAAAEYLELTGLHANIGQFAANAFLSVATLVPFMLLEAQFESWLLYLASTHPAMRPATMQMIVAGGYAALSMPSQIMLNVLGATAFAATVFGPHGTGHYAQMAFNTSLQNLNWTCLERSWSTTGYLSVLENLEQEYRVLRCDHSLLGGEWQLTEQRRQEGWETNESIYAVFTMLEAVRLIEVEPAIPDAAANALVIGLGIGTAPKALLQHGIDTTIVELDPLVHHWAIKYFSLPSNHTAILQDAVAWVQQEARPPQTPKAKINAGAVQNIQEKKQYDYIIHDVFTGGAEPLPLFTTTFLQDLRSLLKPNGVAAINYAGDLSLPLTARILNTIDLAFDRQCKIFRDAPKAVNEADEETFANLIVFCRNSPGPVSFRKPTKEDFLGSKSRQSYLYPREDLQISFPLRGSADASNQVLAPNEIAEWRGEQERSAERHWKIMRQVLPPRVWELY